MKLLTLLTGMFGWKALDEVPTKDGKVNFSEKQIEDLKAFLSETEYAKMEKLVNKELELKASNKKMEDMGAKIKAALKSSGVKEETIESALDGDGEDLDLDARFEQLMSEFKTLKADNKKLQGQVNKLSLEDEPEPPKKLIKNKGIPMQHSATHLFGSQKAYDAFENRPWNKAVKMATDGDYSAANKLVSFNNHKDLQPLVQQLNTDLDLYYTQNPSVIRSLDQDTFGLPSFWSKRLNVVHSVRDAGMHTGELTQARKAGWAPKNNQEIVAEERQVFPIQIDSEWIGIRLQTLAETWLQTVMSSASGSYEQMSFVVFLVNDLNKQREKEDNQYSITGIYVDQPQQAVDGSTRVIPGEAKYRQNGLLYYNWLYRNITKQIRPFRNLGTPTAQNIEPYMDGYVKAMPANLQTKTGLVTYMPWDLYIAYNQNNSQHSMLKELLQELVVHSQEDLRKLDYSKFMTHIKGYPNQRIVPLPQVGKTNFIFTTWEGNIELLENDPKEKADWTFEKSRRDIYGFTDYKIGIGYVYAGKKNVAEDNTEKYNLQHVWCNDQPIFDSNVMIPVYKAEQGVLNLKFNHVYVADGFAGEVARIEFMPGVGSNAMAMPAGTIVKIVGNANLANDVNVKKNTDLLLASDFNLKTAGTLTLVSKGGGKFKELSRTAEANTNTVASIDFELDAIDADAGNNFVFSGDSDTTLADISGGVEGQIVTIKGGSNKLTIANSDSIVVGTSVELANASAEISLIKVGDVWYTY